MENKNKRKLKYNEKRLEIMKGEILKDNICPKCFCKESTIHGHILYSDLRRCEDCHFIYKEK